MEILVKIPDDMVKSLEQGSFGAKYNIYNLGGCLMNGTVLSKNATNRDVINSIFGKNFSIPLATTEEWLDAPYEEVNADGDND